MTSKINFSELFFFFSSQGEGRYTGVPSIFLRMFGCNFRCKNFNRYEKDILGDSETHNPEVVQIIKNLDQYPDYNSLPLVSTGCDSYSSIYPEFKRFVIKKNADDLANDIINLLPYKKWKSEHLVITGGEPLLGWQRAYPDLLFNSKMADLTEITFETNGTQQLTPEFANVLLDWNKAGREITFSVSPKLSSSGEKWSDAIKPNVIVGYQEVGYVYLKFVVANEEDAAEADRAVKEYRSHGFDGPVYLMPVGGIESVYLLNNKKVAELAMKLGYRYSPRLQCDLFKNAWNT